MTTEAMRPMANTGPQSGLGKVKFYGRMLLDLQLWTVYRDLKRTLPDLKGDVLDVGCGQSPYRFLLNPDATRYVGIDIPDAGKFDYDNPDKVPFDGRHIPFPDGHFDAVLCTEVLEHVADFQTLADEIHRVMKDGGELLVTVPWSARFHYVPYDFFRYTPSSLGLIFSKFRDVTITPRGTDVSAIGSKLVVLWFRNAFGASGWRLLWAPLWLVTSPLLLIVIAIVHLCTLMGAGSTDDPLGYTVTAKK
jgi:SAM-dependent methyltransferase